VIVAGVLLTYLAVLSIAAPAVLSRAGWVRHAPRLAIGLWQVLSVSWLLCAVLAGLAMTTSWLITQAEPAFRQHFTSSPNGSP
jgi:hypothetical protein